VQEKGENILILFIVSTLLIAIILILVFVFLLSYQKKIVSQKLLIKQVEMDVQQKLLKASVDAQEKERKRIASDLHDDIGSLLSALKLNVRHLKTVDKIGEEEVAFLDRTATMLDDGLANVRRISYDLLPPSLVRFGLWVTLNELVQLVNNSNQVSINANFTDVENCQLNKNSELSILRVMQELIANSLHHSEASEITISCKKKNGLEIEYRDNGKGITNQSQLQGLGMINMQARIQTLGGKIAISGEEIPHFLATLTVPLI
jgi:signal transduction histidine kinase